MASQKAVPVIFQLLQVDFSGCQKAFILEQLVHCSFERFFLNRNGFGGLEQFFQAQPCFRIADSENPAVSNQSHQLDDIWSAIHKIRMP